MNANHTVDFSVLPGGDVKMTFTQLKALQTLGIADERSSIKFNGITLPAGTFNTFEEYFQVHYAVAANELSNVASLIPATVSSMSFDRVLNAISNESKKLGNVGLTPEEIDAMVEERQKQMETSKQM